mmetsp:Transcript_11281/g.18873  ORF Transcript_11281/g.18873 Transcript_11281/m.18873 type:complete len:803 (-) Transcript_11281:133-2541(-)
MPGGGHHHRHGADPGEEGPAADQPGHGGRDEGRLRDRGPGRRVRREHRRHALRRGVHDPQRRDLRGVLEHGLAPGQHGLLPAGQQLRQARAGRRALQHQAAGRVPAGPQRRGRARVPGGGAGRADVAAARPAAAHLRARAQARGGEEGARSRGLRGPLQEERAAVRRGRGGHAGTGRGLPRPGLQLHAGHLRPGQRRRLPGGARRGALAALAADVRDQRHLGHDRRGRHAHHGRRPPAQQRLPGPGRRRRRHVRGEHWRRVSRDEEDAGHVQAPGRPSGVLPLLRRPRRGVRRGLRAGQGAGLRRGGHGGLGGRRPLLRGRHRRPELAEDRAHGQRAGHERRLLRAGRHAGHDGAGRRGHLRAAGAAGRRRRGHGLPDRQARGAHGAAADGGRLPLAGGPGRRGHRRRGLPAPHARPRRAGRHPAGLHLPGHLDRGHHGHGLRGGLRQAAGAAEERAPGAARARPDEHGRGRRLAGRPGRLHGAALPRDRPGVPGRGRPALGRAGRAHDGLHRRGGHARGDHGAELLQRVGALRGGLHAGPAHAHGGGRAHRLLGRHAHQRDVRRDEPRHRQRAAGRLRAGGQGAGHGGGGRGHRRGQPHGGGVPDGRQEGVHRARVRPGGGQGAVRHRRPGEDPQPPRHQGRLRHPPRRRPHAWAAERAAGGGGRALRHRGGDGGDQRAHRRGGRHAGHRRQRHHQLGGRGGPQLAHRRHARHSGMEEQAGGGDEAVHGLGVRGRGQPGLCEGQHGHAAGRRQGLGGRAAAERQEALRRQHDEPLGRGVGVVMNPWGGWGARGRGAALVRP